MGGYRSHSELIPFVLPNVLPGMIIVWSGSIATIPGGFALCDGNNGTPDLRDRFLLGASGAIAPGTTGGAWNHVHTFTGDGHQHDIPAGAQIAAGSGKADGTSQAAALGTVNQATGMAPYYALAYIMKT